MVIEKHSKNIYPQYLQPTLGVAIPEDDCQNIKTAI
jgi:hypothetical protein